MLFFDIITIIIPLIIIICIPLILLLFIIFNNFSMITFNIYEKFENVSSSSNINTSNYIGISPVVKIAEQVDKLKVLENINKDINNKNNNLTSQINTKGNQLININEETRRKEEVKLKLEDEISKLNKNKDIHNNIASTLVKGITTFQEKEESLKKKEAEIQLKINKLQELNDKKVETAPVKINQEQLDILTNKLILIEKLFKELKEEKKEKEKDICQLYSSLPSPISQDFINNNKKDLPYLWCLCNDNLNKNVDCMEYKNCLNHYSINKDKKTLKEDELNLYFRCINKFPEYPKFLNENN